MISEQEIYRNARIEAADWGIAFREHEGRKVMPSAEEIVAARRALNLPSNIKVVHPDYGSIVCRAFSKEQAEMYAANCWKVSLLQIEDKLQVSLLLACGERESFT